MVQPSRIRVFTDEEYRNGGASLREDMSECKVVFGIKEMSLDFFKPEKTYVFFSHTTKGQPFNMPMLRKILDLGCTLIDYEKITESNGKRLIFFGRHAGLAGMIDTLWALGKRLEWEKIKNPFVQMKQALHYKDIKQAKEDVKRIGESIKKDGLPEMLVPFVCGFAGYGNVSKGAQEIYDQLPVEEISPSELGRQMQKGDASRKKVYKVVFKEKDTVSPSDPNALFELNDYYNHPEKYESRFEDYLPCLTLMVNAIYWDAHYPRLVTKSGLKKLFNKKPRLRMISDISCDVGGAIECNVRCTEPGNPVYLFDPIRGSAVDGVKGDGVVVLAVDNLPGELPLESSTDFSLILKEFVPAIVNADYSLSFTKCKLPDPIRRAVIVYRGRLTPGFEYLSIYLKEGL